MKTEDDSQESDFVVLKMKIDFHQGEEGEGDYTVYECPGLASVRKSIAKKKSRSYGHFL